jgi:hypothetical protein
MSDEQPPGVPLERKTLVKFVDLAETTIMRSELLLSDHFQERIRFSSEVLSRVCEVYASGTILKEVLDKAFDLDLIPEGSSVELPAQSAAAIGKIILSISTCKEYILRAGFRMSKSDDI